MSLKSTALVLVAAVLGVAIAHKSQVEADKIRSSSNAADELVFLPSGSSLKVASMGYHETVGDLLWIRAVLLFGERFGNDKDPLWGEWFAGMVAAINELDPSWRTPYFYGGVMLRVVGAKESSDKVFLRGFEAIPTDPFFPFAYGMNQYLLADDPESAAQWVRKAAKIPGAPSWYQAAAGGLLDKKSLRPAAIRFLQDELEATKDPAVSAVLQHKLLRLIHDELADRLEAARELYQREQGQDISELSDLSKVGQEIPQDPLGGEWIIGPDSLIRSSVREEEERLKAMKRDRAWISL